MSESAPDATVAEPEHVEGEDARGAPDDWEFHLDRVCARFPTRLSARRLEMLAELLEDDTPQ